MFSWFMYGLIQNQWHLSNAITLKMFNCFCLWDSYRNIDCRRCIKSFPLWDPCLVNSPRNIKPNLWSSSRHIANDGLVWSCTLLIWILMLWSSSFKNTRSSQEVCFEPKTILLNSYWDWINASLKQVRICSNWTITYP